MCCCWLSFTCVHRRRCCLVNRLFIIISFQGVVAFSSQGEFVFSILFYALKIYLWLFKKLFAVRKLDIDFYFSGDRIALTQIEQMIDGKYVILGHYDVQADNLTWTGKEKWHGNKVIELI